MQQMHRLLQELRRRRVLRVAGAYTVAGWIALQAAEILMPALSLPPWTLTFVAVLLLIGLPLSMVLAWVFHPPAAQPAEGALPDPASRRGVDAGLLAAVVLAVTVSAVQLASRNASGLWPGSASSEAVSGATSVAVLPFTSFSDDTDDNSSRTVSPKS